MPTSSGRHLARVTIFAMSLVAAALFVPAIAEAGVPTILTVGQVQHHATVVWALPAGTATRSVEISDSPAVSTDGSFFGDHVKSSDSVTAGIRTALSQRLIFSCSAPPSEKDSRTLWERRWRAACHA